jgi:hypothetical protein
MGNQSAWISYVILRLWVDFRFHPLEAMTQTSKLCIARNTINRAEIYSYDCSRYVVHMFLRRTIRTGYIVQANLRCSAGTAVRFHARPACVHSGVLTDVPPDCR